MRPVSKSILASLACSLFASPAHPQTREVDRQEVAERFADDVEQQRRVYCRDTQLFTMTDGTEYRACIDWRAQNRTRVTRTYAALFGPEEDADANLDAARDCFDIGVARANDPYRNGLDEDLFLATARAEFARCAATRNLLQREDYALRLYETGVWLGGSWEDTE